MFDRALVLQKYEVQFFRCPRCGFIATEEPFWLSEAYRAAINRSDVGYVGRNIAFSKMLQSIILLMFRPASQFIDFGGGYGMFVRLMRDLGFDFWWQDKFCENLFAQSFELSGDNLPKFELLTAFEVFEHLNDPLTGIEEMLGLSDSIIFSTAVVPDPPPSLNNWGYYGLEHGQHVAFYSRPALEHIARHYRLHLLSYGGYIHLLSRRKPSELRWNIALNRYSKFLINLLCHRESLLWKDSDRVIRTLRD